MQIRLVAADVNADYLKKLSDVFSRSEAVQWNITMYTDRNYFLENFSRDSCDVLLISSQMYDPALPISGVRLPVLLADPERDGNIQTVGFKRIRKYQRISEIARLILELYADVSPEEDLYGGHTHGVRTLAFYSPAGGAGVTTTAVACAKRLAAAGKRTLYLDLQNVSSSEAFFGASELKGISELFAKLSAGINMTAKVQSLLQTDPSGLFYIGGFDNMVDFEEVGPEDVNALLDLLVESGLFDVIVIDLSSFLTKAVAAVFEKADKIAVVCGASSSARAKWGVFERQYSVYEVYKEKMAAVTIGGASVSLPTAVQLELYSMTDSRALSDYLVTNGNWNLAALI